MTDNDKPLVDALAEALQSVDVYIGGWREMIAELEDFCGESARLKSMIAALNQIDRTRPKIRAALARYAAEKDQPQKAGGWQPIAGAPRDGTKLWLRGNGIYHGVEFVGLRKAPEWPWETECWWNVNGARSAPDHCVTHYMLRPAPPEGESDA